ncbi:hypothetical protein [Methanobrevibacter sp.]|jgi:hypothetical protein|uniref:hypothetical protein n=1 Tax=Methanobrevibacter sp. TaxID=66852 RepID=UPI0026FE880F|nr:hypothetical protein [Methanobrevibacter sp.]
MDFGFSFVGLVFLAMLFVPNILWSKCQPKDYERFSKNENRLLLILERIGEVLVTCLVLLTAIKFSWSLVLAIAFFLMIIYEFYWLRYFKGNHTMKDMYSSFLAIPLPGATLPVLAIFLLGIYANNVFLIISAVILGIGHIGIHYNHQKEVNS